MQEELQESSLANQHHRRTIEQQNRKKVEVPVFEDDRVV